MRRREPSLLPWVMREITRRVLSIFPWVMRGITRRVLCPFSLRVGFITRRVLCLFSLCDVHNEARSMPILPWKRDHEARSMPFSMVRGGYHAGIPPCVPCWVYIPGYMSGYTTLGIPTSDHAGCRPPSRQCPRDRHTAVERTVVERDIGDAPLTVRHCYRRYCPSLLISSSTVLTIGL